MIVENVTGAAGTIGVSRVARVASRWLHAQHRQADVARADRRPLRIRFRSADRSHSDRRTGLSDPADLHQERLAGPRSAASAWLKADPGEASISVLQGAGSTGNLAHFLQNITGTTFQFVPYRGNTPAVQSINDRQIDMMIKPSSNFTAQVQAGTIQAIAVPANPRLFGPTYRDDR